jgi:hypothetical protein
MPHKTKNIRRQMKTFSYQTVTERKTFHSLERLRRVGKERQPSRGDCPRETITKQIQFIFTVNISLNSISFLQLRTVSIPKNYFQKC